MLGNETLGKGGLNRAGLNRASLGKGGILRGNNSRLSLACREGNLPVLGTLWGRWRLEDEKTLEELKADGSLVFEVLCVLCELCVFIISGGLSSPWQGRRGAERRG